MNDKKDTSLQTSPQLVESRDAVALSAKQTVSLYKKSKHSGISFDILEEVYRRGFVENYNDQKAFDRVNSFIAGGAAAELDQDLMETEVWDKPNPVKKHKTLSTSKKAAAKARAKAAGRPYPNMIDNMWAARNEEKMQEGALNERGADSKGYYRSTESGAGLTAKGAKHFGIKTAVTTPPSKLKAGSKAANRRKSFCARMSGMKGPMKDEKGRPTRKAMSLRRWNCHEEEIRNQVSKESIDRPDHTEFTRQSIKKKKAFEEYTGAEKVSKNKNDASSRFDGTTSLVNVYKDETPGEKRAKVIKAVVRECLEETKVPGFNGPVSVANVKIRMANGKIKSMPPGKSGSSGGGGDEE